MLQYVLAGLVLGGLYAIASAGIVVTYRATGILNLAFGAMAYFIARFYYFLNTQHDWGIVPSALVAVVLGGPLIGVLLYYALFRMLRLATSLVKVVATLGVSVCLPPLAVVLFGNENILKAPGLAPQPVAVYDVFGVPVTMDQLIIYAAVLAVVVCGALVLQLTDIGLAVRAMVDSPAMMSLSGSNPNSVSVGVWAVSTFLAGLAGVLAGPVIGLAPADYTLLMCAAFAAVIAGKLRNLPVAVCTALLMGIAGSLVVQFLPADSSLTNDIIASIPFVVASVALIYVTLRGGSLNEDDGVGGALDRAIAPQAGPRLESGSAEGDRLLRKISGTAGWRPSAVIILLLVLCIFNLDQYWVGLISFGVAYGVVFLSYTLVAGEGGMIWLCQASFAGVGALTTAQLTTEHGWPVMLAVIAGGAVALPMGLLLGLLTIRLGDLYVALVTLMFGLLADNLLFSRDIFLQGGLGVPVPWPSFVLTVGDLALVSLVVFCVLGLVIVNLRRSTTGLALGAVRWSGPGSRTIGISVVTMKVIVSGFAALVAGIGGGLLAMNFGAAIPANYTTLTGVVWLAVLVTAGIKSNMAALIAGLMFSVIPGAAVLYLDGSWGQLPPILFGLGAVILATDPEGFVMQNAKALSRLLLRLAMPRGGNTTPPGSSEPGGSASDTALQASAVGGDR